MDIIDLALEITGTVTVPTSTADPTPRKIVFQGASNVTANYWTKAGRPRQVRAHVIPADPKTPAQLARRDNMRAAVTAWQTLTDTEKTAWRDRASERGISGYNTFCSHHLKTFQP